MRRVVFVFSFVCLIEIAFSQAIGCNGLGMPNLPLANGLAPGMPTPNPLALGAGLANPTAAAANLAGMPIPGLSPTGYGDVAIVGELPVGGTTAVVGNVPIVGFVTFEGIVPANGMVSLASNCECNSVY